MSLSNWQILARNKAILGARACDYDRGKEIRRAERFEEIDGPPHVRFERFLWAGQRNSRIALRCKMKNSFRGKPGNELREACAVPHIALFESSLRPRILGCPVIHP